MFLSCFNGAYLLSQQELILHTKTYINMKEVEYTDIKRVHKAWHINRSTPYTMIRLRGRGVTVIGDCSTLVSWVTHLLAGSTCKRRFENFLHAQRIRLFLSTLIRPAAPQATFTLHQL